ncbi:MAG: sensor histidine kinase [Acidobacteriaceae bacterium]|nr:sensor histidine kinase [Acidobacteriaceae bacterium]
MQFERLHHLGTRLRSRVGFRSIVAEALLTTVSVAQADAGILQLYDCESASLQLLAQYGVEYPAVQAIEFLSGNAAVAIFADEEARRSIARDLHDDIGQRAALIAMNLQSLCRSLCNESDPSDPTSAQLASVTRDVDALGGRLRELSHQLHPMIVEHLGLAHAVRSLVQDFNRGYQMKATIQSDKPCEGISVTAATTLYRIAQEALSNAAKYARTADITIALSEEAGEVHLVIRDNGPGFEPAVKHGRGLGVMSMQERALALDGECEIRSNIGQGTEIKVRVAKYSEHKWSERPSCSEPWLKSGRLTTAPFQSEE